MHEVPALVYEKLFGRAWYQAFLSSIFLMLAESKFVAQQKELS